MKFGEKIARLTEEKNRSHLARAAGLPSTMLSNYVNRGSTPRADIALEIARVLQVQLEWLIDDKQDWPPPKDKTPAAEQLSDHELMNAMAKRYRQAVLEFIEALNIAGKIDWQSIVREVEHTKSNEPLPVNVDRALKAFLNVNSRFTHSRHDFDLEVFCMLHHERLPGGDLPLAEIEKAERSFSFAAFDNNPDVMRFMRAIASRPEYLESEQRRMVLQSQSAMIEVERKLRPQNIVSPEDFAKAQQKAKRRSN